MKELEGFEELPRGSVVLVISAAENTLKKNIEILKFLLGNGYSGIYITINQPYKTLNDLFADRGLDIEKIFFIDSITKTIKGEPKREENCLFISSPQGLTELGIAVSEAMGSLKTEKNFLFLDSLSTLLIYNSTGSIAKFSHFLMNKIRLSNVTGIFISIEKEMDRKLISQLSQFSDRTISLK